MLNMLARQKLDTLTIYKKSDPYRLILQFLSNFPPTRLKSFLQIIRVLKSYIYLNSFLFAFPPLHPRISQISACLKSFSLDVL